MNPEVLALVEPLAAYYILMLHSMLFTHHLSRFLLAHHGSVMMQRFNPCLSQLHTFGLPILEPL